MIFESNTITRMNVSMVRFCKTTKNWVFLYIATFNSLGWIFYSSRVKTLCLWSGWVQTRKRHLVKVRKIMAWL